MLPPLASTIMDAYEDNDNYGDILLDELLNLDTNEWFSEAAMTLHDASLQCPPEVLNAATKAVSEPPTMTTPEPAMIFYSSVPNPLAASYEQAVQTQQFVPISPTPSAANLMTTVPPSSPHPGTPQTTKKTAKAVPSSTTVRVTPSPIVAKAKAEPKKRKAAPKKPVVKKEKATAEPPAKRQRPVVSSDEGSTTSTSEADALLSEDELELQRRYVYCERAARCCCDHHGCLAHSFDFSFPPFSNRNRQHAKRSRLRKKCLTKSLEQSLMDLKAENQKLRLQIYGQFGKDQTESMIQARVQSPTKRFVRALQRPENRYLGQNAFDFLRSLRDDLPMNKTNGTNAVPATAEEQDKTNKETPITEES